MLILLTAFSSFSGCGGDAIRDRKAPPDANALTPPVAQSQPGLNLSPEQQLRRDQLAADGGLRIVTRVRESIYEPDRNGTGEPGGMEYLRAKRLAELLDLPLVVTLVDDFSDYFTIDGRPVRGEEALPDGATPDLLRENHILVDGFGYRAWRARLIRFVPITPDKNVVLTRRESGISAPEDLDGRTVAVAAGSVFSLEFEELARRHGLTLEQLVVNDTPEMSRALVEERADASGAGSIAALFEIENYPQLTIAFPFPDPPDAPEGTGWSNWAVAKDDAVLASIIETYIAYIHASGYFYRIWEEQFAVPFDDYLQMLNLTVE